MFVCSLQATQILCTHKKMYSYSYIVIVFEVNNTNWSKFLTLLWLLFTRICNRFFALYRALFWLHYFIFYFLLGKHFKLCIKYLWVYVKASYLHAFIKMIHKTSRNHRDKKSIFGSCYLFFYVLFSIQNFTFWLS